MPEQSATEIHLQRSFHAPPGRVFDALTKPASVPSWLGPSDAYRVTVHAWDCKPGGKLRVEFVTPEKVTHIVVGVFKEVTPHTRLAFSWTWEGQPVIDSIVTFTLRPEGKGTALVLTHTGFPGTDMRNHHNEGWLGTLDRLSRALAAPGLTQLANLFL